MANSLGALKSLPCPAGDGCTAFQCLFRHDRDPPDNADNAQVNNNHSITVLPSTYSSAVAPRARPTKHILTAQDQSPPNKRVKTGANVRTTPESHSIPNTSPPTKTVLSEQRNTLSKPSSANIQGISHPHSPSAQHPVSAGNNKNQTTFQHVAPPRPVEAAPSTQPKAVSTTPKPKPVKKEPEALNPRLLKKSPCGHGTRVALVKALHKEYARLNTELKKIAQDGEKDLLLSDQDLITKTLDEEQELAIKKFDIYNTSIRNHILRYKKMSLREWEAERERQKSQQQVDMTTPKPGAAAQPIDTGLTSAQEIKFLPRLAWDLAGMEKYGYVNRAPSEDEIQAAQKAVEASQNTEHCDRCTRRFQVFPGRRESDGALCSNGSCTFHPGKPYYDGSQKRYRCCERRIDDDTGGCTTAPTHVFKVTDPKRLAAVLNFTKTPVNPSVPKDRAVAFDCEMGFTVYGLELIRLTVVSWPDGKEILDILVRPFGEVLDLNTRFSGVRPEDITSAEVYELGGDHRPTLIPSEDPTKPPKRKLKIASSPKAARDLFFTLIDAETPLIGHGLENDLNAVRIVHPKCIDTVILFPHTRGLPFRNGLKYLMQAKLNRRIQMDSDEAEGHDSAEDARAAGELVRLAIRTQWRDMKLKDWTLGPNDDIIAPGSHWVFESGKARRIAQ